MASTDWGDFDPWAEDPSDDLDKDGGREDREDTFGAQHVLVLIDCRPSMFVPSIPGEQEGETISPMQASLKACEQLLRSKVKHVAVHKTGKRDGVGIMLYGIPDNTNSTHPLVELQQPGVEQIQKIRAYVEGKASVEEDCKLEDMKSKKTSWTLRKALQKANEAITKAKCVKQRTPSDKALPDGKSLWIFTNDDDPLKDDEDREKIEKAAGDAIENGVEIHVWPMKTPFNSDFYDSILTTPVPETEETFDVEDLMDRIQREFRKQRKAFQCPMLLPNWREHPEDPGIMIDFYRPVQIQKKPQPFVIHQQTKKETQKVTNILDDVTGETLYSSADSPKTAAQRKTHRLRTITHFGGKTVPIAKEEVATMKKLSNADQERASIILLGFKPKDSLPMHYTVENSFYLYPNDEKVKGSTAAFANLHAAMIRKGVLAIGELMTRVTATSRLVAIFPQKEEYLREEDGGGLETPPGMVAYVLPFEDDVRALEPDAGAVDADKTPVQAATDLINAMNFGDGFSLDYLKNDSLAHFYTYLESIALETTLPTPEQSLNQITDEDVRATAGEQIDAFSASLPDDVVPVKEPKKRKREPDETGCDWLFLYRSNDIASCTIPMLKSYLKSCGEKTSGKKADLVERVSLSIGARIASGELQSV